MILSEFHFPGSAPIRMTDTGTKFPEDLSQTNWAAVGERLDRSDLGLQWTWIDWYTFGERKWPHEFWQFLPQPEEADEHKRTTFYNWSVVGRKFPPEKRVAGVSFSHHAAVASIDDEAVRQQMLENVRDSVPRWTVRRLYEEAARWKRQMRGEEDAAERQLPIPTGDDPDRNPLEEIRIVPSVASLRTVAMNLTQLERSELIRILFADLSQEAGVEPIELPAMPPRTSAVLQDVAKTAPPDFPASYKGHLAKIIEWFKRHGDG